MFFSADKDPNSIPSHSEKSSMGSTCLRPRLSLLYLTHSCLQTLALAVCLPWEISRYLCSSLYISLNLSSQWGISCLLLLKSYPIPSLIVSSPKPLLFFFFKADRLCIEPINSVYWYYLSPQLDIRPKKAEIFLQGEQGENNAWHLVDLHKCFLNE